MAEGRTFVRVFGPANCSTFAVMSKPVNIIFEWPIAAAAEAGAQGVWLRLLPAGTFMLRDGRGPYDAGGKAELQAIVDRTLQHAAATELMVDYDHQAVFGAQPGVGGRAEAAGWIKQLEARDDGIYGLVQWTAEAAAKIEARAYRYLSPLFTHTGKTSGRVGKLLNVGLVNMPALDLAAVAASSLFTEKEPEDMNAIARALGLADGASEAAILAALNERHGKVAAAVGLKPDASFDDVLKAAAAALAGLNAVAAAAGLQVGATSEQVVAAMAKSVPMSMVTELQTQVKTLQQSIEGKEVAEAVAAAMQAGKVSPAQEAWARTYAKADLAGFKTFVDNAPVLVKTQLGDNAQIPAGHQLDANTIAARARAYQDEQAKAGITVSISDAVTHVEAEAAKAKK